MKVLAVLRVFAAVLVLTVAGMTAAFAYHVHVRPVGGPLTRLLPEPGSLDSNREAIAFARSLENQEIPDIEPGEQAYQKAMEMMASGRMEQAQAKLTTIFNVFPNSSVARNARRIVSDMNLDRMLGNLPAPGSESYRVRAGDSYLAIASRHATSIDMMIHLNSMQRLKGIQPGDELWLMPLNLRVLVEPRRQAVSLWDGGRFICEYAALSMKGVPGGAAKTTISRKIAELDGQSIPPHGDYYSAAPKVLQLSSPPLQIRGWERKPGAPDDPPPGILLRAADMEELSLLTRPQNVVEFR